MTKNNAYHRRKNRLGSMLLFDNIFKGRVDRHHISDAFTIDIPRWLHKQHRGRFHRENLQPHVEELYQFSYIIIENGETIEGEEVMSHTDKLKKMMSKRNHIIIEKRIKNKYQKSEEVFEYAQTE